MVIPKEQFSGQKNWEMKEKLFQGKLWPSEYKDENLVVWKLSS